LANIVTEQVPKMTTTVVAMAEMLIAKLHEGLYW